ncbi:hypothetical protein LP419_03555 [Massilia sp. H-1]|nr:hypothetical protein LP419_03555 [Massilia sp. H-1]
MFQTGARFPTAFARHQHQHGKAVGIADGAQQHELFIITQQLRDRVTGQGLNQGLPL